MSATLHDPNLPPGAIVETYVDDSALRNDGTKLTPAAQNPWYVLATVAGEQKSGWPQSPDFDLHAKNRRFWNAWMCQGMDDDKRNTLASQLRITNEEILPITENEIQEIISRFKSAFPDEHVERIIPESSSWIQLSDLYFKNAFICKGFYFPSNLILSRSYFSEKACFESAFFRLAAIFDLTDFGKEIDFNNSTFCGKTSFNSANFELDAQFNEACFERDTSFYGAYFANSCLFILTRFERDLEFRKSHFEIGANFSSSLFKGPTDFQAAHFAGEASFFHAQFASSVSLSGGAFKGATIFEGARFETRVPEFYESDIHQNTTFSEDRGLWPAVTDMNAASDKQAYTRLRQIAAGNHNPDLEHFFLRQEMRCKQHLARRFDKCFFGAYALFSDYGISVARPVVGLALVLTIGALAIGWHLCVPGQEGDVIVALRQALGISLGNILPFLGIVPRIFPEFHASAPWWLNTLAVFQSLAGIVFLFFLGLGLRNRFRLR